MAGFIGDKVKHKVNKIFSIYYAFGFNSGAASITA